MSFLNFNGFRFNKFLAVIQNHQRYFFLIFCGGQRFRLFGFAVFGVVQDEFFHFMPLIRQCEVKSSRCQLRFVLFEDCTLRGVPESRIRQLPDIDRQAPHESAPF
jgi:hypothetical protein